jgi:hypothetical protein
MWYIGSRTAKGCHPNDGYICSSNTVKPMIKENKSEWLRVILRTGAPKHILKLETRFLCYVNAKNNPMSYNKHNGDGVFVTLGNDNPMKNPKIAKKVSDAIRGENHWTAKLNGKPNPQCGQVRPSISGDKHPNKNPINAAKISASHKGKKHEYALGDNNVMRRPEVAAKLSGSNHWTAKTEKLVCKYCGVSCTKSNHTRWHGSKCRHNTGGLYDITG